MRRNYRPLVLLVVGVLAFVHDAKAQLDQLPQCASQCAVPGIESTGCQALDVACICASSSFITGLTSCVQTSCSTAEIQQTIKFAQDLCLASGVTLSVPDDILEPTSTPESTTSTLVPEVTSSPSTTRTTTTPFRPTREPETSSSRTSSSSSSRSTSNSGSTPEPTSESDTPEEPQRESKAASAGIIAAGVLGGIVGIILIIGLFWFLRKRHRKNMVNGEKAFHTGGPQPLSNLPVPPPAPVGEHPQGIWSGEAPYSWNPARQTPQY